MQLETIKLVPGELIFNFDELKGQLSERLENYKGLVVTEDNEREVTKDKAELNKLVKAIDDYRKNQKKEMSAPITEFENKCKELTSLVTNVVTPIADQLKAFEDARKEEKRTEVQRHVEKVINDLGLNQTYSSQLDIIDKYLNKTQKLTDTINDLEKRGKILKQAQDQEELLEKAKREKIDLIQKTIEDINKKYQLDFKISDFFYLQMEEARNIPNLIESKAQEYLENLKKKQVVVEEKAEVKEVIQEEKIYKFILGVTASLEQARLLKEFLDKNNIQYSLKKED
ncbi:MAG: DUF1351 domain-containing protein [Fusobacterium sp.]|uniref:DUF1351 domain-containing protein n=1 Tax=Fusobacterium sp. TaxID=68766 RepID=UPI003992CA33